MAERRPAVDDRLAATRKRMSDAFLAFDADWAILDCDGTAARLLGRDRDSLLGRQARDALPEFWGTTLHERVREAKETGERVACTTYYEPADARLSVRAFPAEDGGLEVYFRNVSFRHRREREFSRYATAIEAVGDGVVIADESGRVTTANATFTAELEANRSELIGTELSELAAVSGLGDEDASELAEGASAVRKGNSAERRVHVDLPPDGTRVGELRIVPLGGTPRSAVAGILRDVTERHEYERVVTALHDATRELFRADDPAEVCAAAVHTGSELLDLGISGIWLLDEGHNRLEPVAATAGAHDVLEGLPTFTEDDGPVWRAFRRGEPRRYDDVPVVDHEETPLRSALVVPIGAHGVLVAGEIGAGEFEPTDLDLAEILGANTRAVLDRLERDRLLDERATELDRRGDRLETIESLVAGPLSASIERIDETDGEPDEAELAQARGLTEAVTVLAGRERVGVREELRVGRTIERVRGDLDEPVPSIEVREECAVRADEEWLAELARALLRCAALRSADEIRIGRADGRPRESPGFYAVDDGRPFPEEVGEPPFDEGQLDVGIAVARHAAAAHGWRLTVDAGTDRPRVEVTDVTTLSTPEN